MTINHGIFSQPGQGDSYSVAGDITTFKATSEQTDGNYALFEVVVAPQLGPPPHIHSQENEAFYIQEGVIEFYLDEQTILATPGTFLHSPKGQLHSFKNIGETPAKMLIWATPGGIEKFFAQVGTKVENSSVPPLPITQELINRILATAPEYGITIVLPEPDNSL
ncbi:quercetin 2,3-dioxygenase [Nostoc sp. FACHB-152]|uniref:quercetin 2,3-dioxygenase n=1 Tax=unclassified Nostoc TaxID=2593658 RepID=UPI0016856892|nr:MULTISPECIES: quercetin 2,3-dioxygenase [unclassified Nostoc]MBD2449996.1 quercetin 2,3-dioxygenase [Nostoc sp. FACHB-152]MBD2468412.1 quercetin 2,3-dioxygenase [Nostoc sp. FACHB-145]